MNFKPIPTLATIAVAAFAATAATSALASEATQFTDQGGPKDRAEVRAELARADDDAQRRQPGEVYGHVEPGKVSTRSRDDVRREASAESRSGRLAARYTGP